VRLVMEFLTQRLMELRQCIEGTDSI